MYLAPRRAREIRHGQSAPASSLAVAFPVDRSRWLSERLDPGQSACVVDSPEADWRTRSLGCRCSYIGRLRTGDDASLSDSRVARISIASA